MTAFMSAATKVAAFMLAFRLLRTAFPQEEHLWSWALAAIAVASLVVGNFAALVQRNVKRMLAYSSISHAGFILIGLAAASPLGGRAFLYYLIPYSAMAFGSFAIVGSREHELGGPVTLENSPASAGSGRSSALRCGSSSSASPACRSSGGFTGSSTSSRPRTTTAGRGSWSSACSRRSSRSGTTSRSCARCTCAEVRVAVVAGGSPPREPLLHAAVGLGLVVAVGSLFAVRPLIDLARHAADSLPF